MQRAPWTLMQWSSLECKFVPKNNLISSRATINRKRIPQVDKLLEISIDPQLKNFVNAIKSKNYNQASTICDDFSDSIDVGTIRDCCNLLTSKSIPLGEKTKLKLSSFDFKDHAIKPIGLETTEIENKLGPLEILKEKFSNDEAQYLLNHTNSFNPDIQALKIKWYDSLINSKKLQTEFNEFLEKNMKNNPTIKEYLRFDSQVDIVATFMAKFTTSSVNRYFPQSLAYLCRQLGNKIEEELLGKVSEDKLHYKTFQPRSHLVWAFLNESPWNIKQKIILGSFWVNAALQNLKFSMLFNGRVISRPAFWRTWYMSGPSKKGIIVTNQVLISQLREKLPEKMFITSDQIPLLTPPEPWASTTPSSQELYNQNLRLIASQSTEGHAMINESIKKMNSLPHIKALNRLQSQKWKINQRVLSILREASPPNHASEEHFKSSSRARATNNISGASSRDKLKLEKRINEKLERARKISVTQWTQALDIADALGDREFYLPMYMDFRGRCYPMSHSSLSFMGNDSFRSLFLFSDSKPLGDSGLMWLKIHLANSYGECKLSTFNERVQWVDVHLNEILKCGENPRANNWWTKGSKPYQVLAACIEIYNAMNNPEGPEFYCSGLPIQLDGTSNGLQHLVALSKDSKNAPSVNLKGETRGDVYTMVANSLMNDPNTKTLLNKEIDRSIVKKAVMIYFYGGSIGRLADSLAECGIKKAYMLATNIKMLLDFTFKSSREVQQWLVNCTHRLMQSSHADYITSTAPKANVDADNDETHPPAGKVVYEKPTLTWTSPLGLPIVQPYVQSKMIAIRTPLQSFYYPSPFHIPICENSKQEAGVAANFIHSLDAAHMLSTANAMPPQCSFSAIHDSFWTHAATVSILNKVLREQFINIHSQNILDNIWQEWNTRYRGFMVLATIYKNSPLYNVVKTLRAENKENKEAYILEKELIEFSTHGLPIQLKEQISKHPLEWGHSGPLSGTPEKRSPPLKAWVPLELPPPPAMGSLDINDVKNATYFFN